MATDLEIANSALIKLGQEKIVLLNDGLTKRGITISEQFPKVRRRLIREHSWNFAIKRTKLSVSPYEIPYTDISIADNTFTKTAHGYITGLKVQVSTDGTLPAPLVVSTDYFVIKITVNTFKLATSLANSLVPTPIDITTQGTGSHTTTCQDITPEFEYDSQMTLPSDYVKILKVTSDADGINNIDHKLESNKLLVNSAECYLKYTAVVTDASLFPDDFSECFALLLAAECAYDITQSKELAIAKMADYDKLIALTKFNNGYESTQEQLQLNYFTSERS